MLIFSLTESNRTELSNMTTSHHVNSHGCSTSEAACYDELPSSLAAMESIVEEADVHNIYSNINELSELEYECQSHEIEVKDDENTATKFTDVV